MNKSLLFLLFLLPSLMAYGQCDPSFSVAPSDSLCPGETFTFTANADPGATVSYDWNFGDGNTATGQTATHAYGFNAAASTFTATLTVTDTSSGPPCTQSQTITVPATPSLAISVDQAIRCTTDTLETSYTVTFTIDVAQTPLSQGPFTWDFGDGTTIVSSLATISHTYNCFGTYDTRVFTPGNNCPGYTQTIRFYKDPVSGIGINVAFVCEGTPITVLNLSDTSSCNNIDYYIWDWGANGPTYTLNSNDDQTYNFSLDPMTTCDPNLPFLGISDVVTLTAVNFCDPTGQFSATQIKIRPKPLALFDPPDTLCFPAGATAIFNNNSCPNPTLGYADPLSFVWTFGEPSTGAADTSVAINPTHTYTAPGKYTVTLIATNQCGADTTTREVVVIEAPTVFAAADTNQVCAGGCVNYTNFTIPDTAIARTDFLWTISPNNGFNFPMGSSATQHSPTICFNQPGTYFVQLRAENECGVGFWLDTVTVYARPTLALDTLVDTCGVFILDTLTYTFNDNGTPITNYDWQFLGGNPAVFNGQNFPPVNFNAGLDTIVLSISNICGVRRDSISFLVDTVSNVFAGNDTILCRNDSGPVFNGTPGPGFWSGPSVDPNTGKFIPDTVGQYELIYTYQAASCRVYDTLLVTVVDTPVVVAMADTAFCFETVSLTLNASPAGGTWSGGVPLQAGNIFNVDSAGIFVFTYTFVDPLSACEGSDQVVIEVYPIPDVMAGMDTTYCLVPDPQQLPTPNLAGGLWSGLGVSDPVNGIYTPSLLGGAGVDTVVYTFTSADMCVGRDTIIVTVVIGDMAIAGPGDTLCYNAAIDTLTGFTPTGGIWSGNGLLNPSIGEIDPLQLTPGSNQLIYTVAAGTSCEAKDTTFVLVYDTLAVTLPPDITVCVSAADFQIAGFAPAGGLWSGSGVSPTGLFSPSSVPPATTVSLTYSVINADGCQSRDVMTVFVAPLPTVNFSQPDSSCVNVGVPFVNSTTGAVSYAWDFGDGNVSSAPNPTHTYANAGAYTIKLIATSIENCQDSLSRTIFINEAPIIGFSKDLASGCAPLDVTFTDLSVPNGATYSWSFGNFQTFNGPNPGTITFPQGTQDTTYYITLTLTNECTSLTLTDSVEVFPQPQVNFGTDVSIGCSPLPVNFANVSRGDPINFFWYRNLIDPDSLISTDTIPLTQILTTGQFNDTVTFFLVATNNCGADTLARQVIVQPNTMDAFFNTDLPQGCAPHTVTFTDFSGAPFTGWDINNTQPTGNSVSYTFNNPGTYTVLHYANNGCSYDTNSVQITVFPAPIVDFVPSITTICQGDSVVFTNNSIGTTGYEWAFGDGDTSMAVNPVHYFDSAGTYTVILTAYSDTSACPNTHTETIVVRDLPLASFCLSDTAGCPALNVNFACTPPNLSYSWDFGGLGTSAAANPSFSFTQTGTYIVNLTTIDAIGCQNDTSAQVLVYPVPNAAFSIMSDTCGENVPVVFTDQASTVSGALTYVWDFGDTNGSSQTSPTHIYGQTGIFNVQQKVSNVFGCMDSITDVVQIFPQPIVDLQADTLTGCVPLLVNFDGTASQNASHYRWSINGAFAANGALFSHTFGVPDQVFNVQLVVDTASFCFDSTSIAIETASEPIADFSLNIDQGCDSLTVSFNDMTSSTRAFTLAWDFGDGSPISTLNNPIHTFGTAGIYIVSLTVSNDFGCQSVHQDTVVVHPQPVVDLQADTLTGCVPLLVNFDGTASQNASNYRWSIDGVLSGTAPLFSHTFSAPDQVFNVQLVVDTAGFCFDSTTIVIETASEPVADFSLDLDEGCDSLVVSFSDLSSSTRAYTVSWDFGDGSPLSTLNNPIHTFGTAGIYIVSLTVSNDFDCQSVHQDTVVVHPQPVVDLQADTLTGCVPLLVNFDGAASQNASNYRWSIDGVFAANGPLYSHTFSAPDQVFNVQLVVDTAGFCFDSTTIVIETASEPVADFSINADQGCDSLNVSFSDLSSSTRVYTASWDFGDGSPLSTLNNPTHTFGAAGIYIVSLTISNDFGCQSIHQDTITVHPQPIVDLQADTLTGCVPLVVNFDGAASQNVSNYFWTIDGVFASNAATFSNTFNAADQSFVVRLVVDTASFCFATDSITIETASEPVADFSLDLDEGCDSLTVAFSDLSSSTRAYTLSWDFGDGSPVETINNPTHAFGAAGIYIVSLTVSNDFGCQSIHQDTVQVHPTPVAQIQTDTLNGCVPFIVNFDGTASQNASNFSWDVAGLASFSNPSFSYSFLAPDQSFTITLVVDTAGFCFDTTDVVIQTASEPQAQIGNLSGDRFCAAPQAIDFVDQSSSTRPYLRVWDFGDGSFTDTTSAPSHTYSNPGTYIVQLSLINDFGCVDTAYDTVTVYPQPIAAIDHNPVQGCTPLTVDFTNLSQNYSNSVWNFGYPGADDFSTNPSFTYFLTDTVFTITLIVDTAGFCFDTATVNVSLASEPIANFVPSSVDTCGPALFRFTNTSSSVLQPLAYVWDFGPYGGSSLENPEIFFSDSGSVEVSLVSINPFGCADTVRQTITVYPQPEALFDGVPQSGCEPLIVQLTDLSTDATTWEWTIESQSPAFEQNPRRTFLAGSYDVSLAVSYMNQCFDTLSITDFVNVDRSPVADFVYENIPFGPDQKSSGEVEFISTSFDAADLFWDLGDGSTMTTDSFRHVYTLNDSFDVSLIVFNDLACSDTMVRTVKPNAFGCLQVPNALAPLAGSGDFNKFWPKGVGLQEYEIAIYTIWGERIWQSNSLVDGVPNEWWDGTIEGKLATVDVFVWKVHRAVFDDGREWDGPREGSVTLIR